MCLIPDTILYSVAEEDIVCWKVVVRYEYLDGSVEYAGVYTREQGRYSKYNKVKNFAEEENSEFTDEKKYGFHSYVFKSDAINSLESKIADELRFNITPITYGGLARYRYEIKECIIPKGTRYWHGTWGRSSIRSYCSESIIMDGVSDRTKPMSKFKYMEDWRNIVYTEKSVQTRVQSMWNYFEENANMISILYNKYHKQNVSIFQYQGI